MGYGDELMVTGHVRELQVRDPRKVRIVYEKPKWWDVWDHNPRIAHPQEIGDFQEYRPREGYLRPYIAGKTKTRWQWKPYRPPRGEIYFTEPERAFGSGRAGHVVIGPHLKPGASPNKDWGPRRWRVLVELMRDVGVEPVQLVPPGTRPLDGVPLIETRTVRLAASVMAHALAAVLQEGGLHHVAAAVGTPAVVIFGGFISPQVTGYDEQVSLFDGSDLGCGWRVPCAHCVKAMEAIEPERVFGELEDLLVRVSGHRVS